MVLETIFQATLIIMIITWAGGSRISLVQSLQSGVKHIAGLFPVIVIIYLAGFLGILAFVIPGLLVFSRLAYANFMVVAEGYDPFRALRASIEATEKNFIEIIMTAILPWTIVVAIFLSVYVVVDVTRNFYVISLLNFIFSTVQAFFLILLFRYYFAYKEQQSKE